MAKKSVSPKPPEHFTNDVLCEYDLKAVDDAEVLKNARKWARLNLLAMAGVGATAPGSGMVEADVDLCQQVAFIADEWASEALHRFGTKAVARWMSPRPLARVVDGRVV